MKRGLAWESAGEWGRTRIYARPTGWRIEFESRMAGEITGRVLFAPYGGDFPRGADLSRPWNAYCCHGDALSNRAYNASFAPDTRRGEVCLLRRGEVVR